MIAVPPSLYDDMQDSAYNRDPKGTYDVPEEYIQEWTAVYYALIEEVDIYIDDMFCTFLRLQMPIPKTTTK